MAEMRDRLINLLQNFADGTYSRNGYFVDNTQVDDVADYLLENGVIVQPCKVGDILYDIYDYTTVKEITVKEINIRIDKRNKPWLIIGGYYYGFVEFGKTVFLTKEEAEAKLKEFGK